MSSSSPRPSLAHGRGRSFSASMVRLRAILFPDHMNSTYSTPSLLAMASAPHSTAPSRTAASNSISTPLPSPRLTCEMDRSAVGSAQGWQNSTLWTSTSLSRRPIASTPGRLQCRGIFDRGCQSHQTSSRCLRLQNPSAMLSIWMPLAANGTRICAGYPDVKAPAARARESLPTTTRNTAISSG